MGNFVNRLRNRILEISRQSVAENKIVKFVNVSQKKSNEYCQSVHEKKKIMDFVSHLRKKNRQFLQKIVGENSEFRKEAVRIDAADSENIYKKKKYLKV